MCRPPPPPASIDTGAPPPCLRTLGARRVAPPVCAALDTAVAHRRCHPARCWTPASIVHPEYHKQYLLRPQCSPRPFLVARAAFFASAAKNHPHRSTHPHGTIGKPSTCDSQSPSCMPRSHAGMILAAPHLRPCITHTGVRRTRGVSPVRRAPPPVPAAPAAAAPHRRRPAHRLPAHPAVDCLGSRPPCTLDPGLTPRSDSGRFSGMQTRRERGFS
ncbi:hypothetical protein B0H13DRAFT_1988743 [Mycena leptocephala]|nr:hypothetical protein B0H13DRAFT_1988743 [Mycena leptocephala]